MRTGLVVEYFKNNRHLSVKKPDKVGVKSPSNNHIQLIRFKVYMTVDQGKDELCTPPSNVCTLIFQVMWPLKKQWLKKKKYLAYVQTASSTDSHTAHTTFPVFNYICFFCFVF